MQNQVRSYVRTALFVDFDNVYSNLNSIDPAAGEAFATEPDRWLRWMREEMGQVVRDAAEDAGREILVRACYLNPVMYGKFRPFFTRSAFRVIDCPPLTTGGKNSADTYMVLDILDALQHPTSFDEFILLSADADFTPVMLRLRAHDRRTVLLATGPSATALKSACDMVLPLEIFLNEALEIDLERGGAVQLAEPAAQADAAKRPVAATLDRSGGGFLAVGEALRISGPHPPGYLVDPLRHEPLEPEEPRDPLPDDVADLAHRVARIVGVPQLTSDRYRILFEEIARLSAEGPVSDPLNLVEPDLRNACFARGARIPRQAIHFVLQGLQLAGMEWRRPGQSAAALAQAFADNVIRLSLNARMELTGDETARLRAWIRGPR